eukprot:scaffold5061_cov30-Phaeocystis_antarctica.AAC.1
MPWRCNRRRVSRRLPPRLPWRRQRPILVVVAPTFLACRGDGVVRCAAQVNGATDEQQHRDGCGSGGLPLPLRRL